MSYKYILLFALYSTSSLANTVYTWEDSDGVRHFSDAAPTESVNSKALSLPTSTTQQEVIPEKSVVPKSEKQKKKKPSEADKKLTVAIKNLTQEETIRSSRGHLTVLANLNRKLGVDEKLQLMLDGSAYGLPQSRSEWKLTNIDRGTHIITVIAQKNGKRIASSSIITIHMHRPSAK